MLQRSFVRSLALAAAVALPASAGLAQDEVVARVGDTEITQTDVERAGEMLGERLSQVPQNQRREVLIQALIDLQVVADAAREAGIEDSAAFQAERDFLVAQALRDIYFQENIAGAVTEDDVRARYEEEVAKLDPQEEIHARHILVETEDEAKALIQQLDEGADFAELASEHSTGPSASDGGDLGYFTQGQMVPPFEEAAFALDAGSYTEEPVQTEFGYHVIKVEDRRQQEPPAFEGVADQLRQAMVRERFTETLESLKADADIEIIGEAATDTPDASGESQQ